MRSPSRSVSRPPRWSQFESGATAPGADSTFRIADALQTPVSFFYLSVTDTHDGFFRSLRRTSVTHRRRARALAQVARDIAVAAGSSLPSVSIPNDRVNLDADRDKLEQIADDVRAEWAIRRGPVPNVVMLLEQHGAVVIRLPLGTVPTSMRSRCHSTIARWWCSGATRTTAHGRDSTPRARARPSNCAR